MDRTLPASSVHGDSLGKNTGVGCQFLLQGIFPTQESNLGLVHCRQVLYQLSCEGSPNYHWTHVLGVVLDMALVSKAVMSLLSCREKIWKSNIPNKRNIDYKAPLQWSCMGVRVGLWRRLSAEELMLLNCGVGEDSWESLDCKEIQPVHSEGDQPWDFFGGNDAEAETPVLWPPHAKSWLIGKDWCWEGLGAGGEGDDTGWDGWMPSLTQWTWVWVNSGSWWWTGRPGMLRFMGSQRVGHDWATELKGNSLAQKTERRPLWLQSSEKERETGRDREGREMRSESWKALQATVRTLDFVLIAMGGHWRVLSRRMTQFDLRFESLLLLTSFHI